MITHYSRAFRHKRLSYDTALLWDNLCSPLCGILTKIYLYHRQTYDPKGIAMTAELTNVARHKGIVSLINYHIGGMGFNREDAMIKCLAESYERYIPVLFDVERNMETMFGTYEDLVSQYSYDYLLSPDKFSYFTDMQHQSKKFFNKFRVNNPFLWVKVNEIIQNKKSVWIPAHLLFFGYIPKTQLGEFRINSAVSTGTAVHREINKCFLNSLLEIIMIDCAMGHWYTEMPALRIIQSDRTRYLRKLISKSLPYDNLEIEFYYLPSIFPSFNVACAVRSETIPQFCVGLGSDCSLEGAMYKAYLEYFGTRILSQTLAMIANEIPDTTGITNLDDNVLYYALGKGKELIDNKFNPKLTIKDSELPADLSTNVRECINTILATFIKTKKHLAFIDLTHHESKALGLVATKLWSADLIPMSLPYAVPVQHKRFKDYGSVRHLEPHPYA